MPLQRIEYRKDHQLGGGLFALTPFRAGEVVAQFDGEFYDWGTDLLSIPNDPPLYARDHAIQYAPGKSRDSAKSLARCANHSCSPNCGIKDLFNIVTMVEIPVGTELTWDYAMSENNDWFMTCACGAPNCRRAITGYRNLPPEFRLRYTGFISQWLIDADIPYEGPAELSTDLVSLVSNVPTVQMLQIPHHPGHYNLGAPQAS